MDKISDTITSVFHITIKDKRPAVCSSNDDIVWSEPFGLGWRLGISYTLQGWFQVGKVCLHLDHNPSQTEQEQASVSISLKDTADKDAKGFQERKTTITNFGHGQPALLGSWSLYDLTLHPCVSITVTTKARLTPAVTNPLPSTSLALSQSLDSGEFVDTKFYVFSTKRPGTTAGKPRVVYANSLSLGMVLPKSTSSTEFIVYAPLADSSAEAKQVDGIPTFLANMTSDNHMSGDSVLHDYEYEHDSDLDDDDEEEEEKEEKEVPVKFNPPDSPVSVPGTFEAGSSSQPYTRTRSTKGARTSTEDEFLAAPPAYSVSNCQMILVKGVAYKTWLSYIYFRYTGQVSFRPLKSAQSASKPSARGPNQPPSCSPKSMYRLAATLGDERMKEIARRAIQAGLSKNNIVEEAFSWFTAQYATISEYEVNRVSELRKLPEVSSALKVQLKAVSLGEKPWADDVLIAIMDKLNPSGPPP